MVRQEKSALRLAAVDDRAACEGLAVGMTLADARARIPELSVADADPAADLALLVRVAEACRRFTPALALHAPDGIDLDLTGCARLFGGEARLLMAVAARVARLGLTLRSALADTPGLAWAAARYGGGGAVAAGVREAVLAPLPVEALRLEPQACTVLRQLGFKRIGQLLELPRAVLARRLGEAALHRLDEALGRRCAPLELSLEQPPFRAERRMFEPVSEAEQVLQVARDLADDLCVSLEGRGVGGRRFVLELFRVDGAVKRLDVATSRALRHPPRIAALFAERLAGLDEGLQADFGFDQFRLTALQTQPMDATALDLLSQAAAPGAVEALADRLAARGDLAPRRLVAVDVHTPEAAVAAAPLAAATDWGGVEPARFLDTPLRPLRLFASPQPIGVPLAGVPEGPPARFTWRRVTRTVVRAEGPERLEPEWARGAGPMGGRDYYRLEDETGRRYWVFRLGRYDAPEASAALPPHEEIKPVRPPPKPQSRLKLVHPAPPEKSPSSWRREGQGWGWSQDARGRVPEATLEPCPEKAPPPPPPLPLPPPGGGESGAPHPAWFLHGLFG